MAQVVECKSEALSSVSRITKMKERRRGEERRRKEEGNKEA
jgi:hypothetical protein